jgi:hypothetical protein
MGFTMNVPDGRRNNSVYRDAYNFPAFERELLVLLEQNCKWIYNHPVFLKGAIKNPHVEKHHSVTDDGKRSGL